MKFYSHVEIEIEAPDLETAEMVAQEAADTIKDNLIFTVIDAFVNNTEAAN